MINQTRQGSCRCMLHLQGLMSNSFWQSGSSNSLSHAKLRDLLKMDILTHKLRCTLLKFT